MILIQPQIMASRNNQLNFKSNNSFNETLFKQQREVYGFFGEQKKIDNIIKFANKTEKKLEKGKTMDEILAASVSWEYNLKKFKNYKKVLTTICWKHAESFTNALMKNPRTIDLLH
jgi:hypothetical protein